MTKKCFKQVVEELQNDLDVEYSSIEDEYERGLYEGQCNFLNELIEKSQEKDFLKKELKAYLDDREQKEYNSWRKAQKNYSLAYHIGIKGCVKRLREKLSKVSRLFNVVKLDKR